MFTIGEVVKLEEEVVKKEEEVVRLEEEEVMEDVEDEEPALAMASRTLKRGWRILPE
jgi:hypothetical protein